MGVGGTGAAVVMPSSYVRPSAAQLAAAHTLLASGVKPDNVTVDGRDVCPAADRQNRWFPDVRLALPGVNVAPCVDPHANDALVVPLCRYAAYSFPAGASYGASRSMALLPALFHTVDWSAVRPTRVPAVSYSPARHWPRP